MMRTLRERHTMQAILWGLVVAFVATIFLAWGMDLRLSSRDPNVIAKVGGVPVTYTEFLNLYRPALERLSAGGAEPAESLRARLQEHTLERLLDRAVLRREAEALGLEVGVKEVADSILREPVFHSAEGRFERSRYLEVLRSLNLTPDQFEQAQAGEILLAKTRAILRESTIPAPGEIEAYAAMLSRELQALFVRLDPSEFHRKFEASREELEAWYEDNRVRYDKPERVQVRHILLSLPEGASAEEEEIAKKSLEGYRQRVAEGKDTFQDLAKQFSQDPGSKGDGGLVGWISRGQTVPEFEQAAFALKKGEMSEPVRTRFGYHLILVEDREKGFESTFAKVQNRVRKDYLEERADAEIQRLLQEITLRLEIGESLEDAAKAVGLTTQTTDWFDRRKGVPGFRDSTQTADRLAGLHVGEWAGPFPFGEVRAFFEVRRARPAAGGVPAVDRETALERLLERKQEAWLEALLEEGRRKYGVKIFRDRLPEAS